MSTEWKHIDEEKYRESISTLIHYNSKTINSNAALVGIRLTKEYSLDVPYISLRTLIDSEYALPLDYGKGGAANGTVIKQMNMLLEGDEAAKEASAKEISVIRETFEDIKNTPYSVGTEYVDHRLRQILIPKEDAPGGYVSISPMTASSICPLFFKSEQGLVWQHNEKVKKSSDKAQRKIQQAQFGIGGSNPQNIGSLVRSMQRPIFVRAPQQKSSVKAAFSLYHKEIPISVFKQGAFRESVLQYASFREKVLLNEKLSVGMHERQQEERLIQAIAHIVLDMGAEAYEVLLNHSDRLPKEHCLSQEPLRYALVSQSVDNKALRALVDPALRPLCDNWPRLMAQEIMRKMYAAKDGDRLFTLDSAAQNHIEGILEEVFFSCNT